MAEVEDLDVAVVCVLDEVEQDVDEPLQELAGDATVPLGLLVGQDV